MCAAPVFVAAYAAPRLHRDALHSVFAFVEWNELLQCARSCKDWLTAAASLRPSHGRHACCQTDAERELLLRSPMRAHVNSLESFCEGAPVPAGGADTTAASPPLLPALVAVAARLPRLTQLQLIVSYASLRDLAESPWPPQLRTLMLTLHASNVVAGQFALSDEESAALPHFTERLAAAPPPHLSRWHLTCLRGPQHITVPPAILPVLSRIATLTDIGCDAPWENKATQRAFRNMPQLRSLRHVSTDKRGIRAHRVPWSAHSLEQLAAGQIGVDYPPLESLGEVGPVNAALLPLLLRLPSLTELISQNISLPDCGPLLAGLPQLRILQIEPSGDDRSRWWRSAVAALPLCPHLTELSLTDVQALTNEVLADVVRAVPKLQSLTFYAPLVTSLQCLAQTPHLAHTLQSFTMLLGSTIAPAELVHLRPLRALRSVRLLLTGVDPLLWAQMTPGHPQFAARYWPKLERADLFPHLTEEV